MAERRTPARWRPSPATIAAAAMVIGGLLLTGVSWWFLLLVGLGTLGPGLLRELGFLRDRDELQRRADHRAGYHAFLATGAVAFVLVAYFRSGGVMENAHRLATIMLSLLWFTWFFSSLLSYWGPRKTAARVLYSFGAVWLVFAIVSNVGSEWTGWAALLLHPLLAAPFFVLGWLASRSPRVAGALLLVAAVGLFQLFVGFRAGLVDRIRDGVVTILFIGPLLASGVALLMAGRPADDDDEDDDDDEADDEGEVAGDAPPDAGDASGATTSR